MTIKDCEAILSEVADLLHALDKAEQIPDHAFVALKWFRDTFLPKCGYAWAQDKAQRHHWLREAISRRWITTDRLANPRNPEFPTTAIRLNGAAPEVGRNLGQGEDAGFGWTPVSIPGEPMSATVLDLGCRRVPGRAPRPSAPPRYWFRVGGTGARSFSAQGGHGVAAPSAQRCRLRGLRGATGPEPAARG